MKDFMMPLLLHLVPNGIACLLVAVTLFIFWFTGKSFRNERGGMSFKLFTVSLLFAIIFTTYIYAYALGKTCEYLGYDFSLNDGFIYAIFISAVVMVLSWIVIMISGSRQQE